MTQNSFIEFTNVLAAIRGIEPVKSSQYRSVFRFRGIELSLWLSGHTGVILTVGDKVMSTNIKGVLDLKSKVLEGLWVLIEDQPQQLVWK